MTDSSGMSHNSPVKRSDKGQGNWQGYSFAWRFCLYSGMGLCFLYLAPGDYLLQPLLIMLARLVGRVLELTGQPVVVLGQKVVLPGVFGIDIAVECSGAPHLVLFLSGVLAYPAPYRSRLVGVGLGTTAVLLGNLARMVTLFWVGVQAREYFDVAHFYVWGGLSLAGLVLLWMYWLRLSVLPCSLGRLIGKCTRELGE